MSIRDIVRRKADRDVPSRSMERPQALEFQRDMNRLFDDFFRSFDVQPAWPFAADLPATRAISPAVNVSETDKEVTVSAELPGMEEKDVSVDLQDDVLTISGEKNTETEEKGKQWHRREYTYGSFRRSIPLPASVETDKARAKLAKGVLTITLPKRPGDARRRKTIAVSGE